MFKLFKSKSQPSVTTESVDQQIYKDVYSAQELLLAEANRVLSKPIEYDSERHERLKQMYELGFSSASEVKEFNELCDKIYEHQITKRFIEYYQQNYPLHKYINNESVKAICEKYNLLLTRVSDYIAEIPEKNQKEIIAFRIKRKDVRYPDEINIGYRSIARSFLDNGCNVSKEEIEKIENEKLTGQHLLIIAPAHKLNTKGKVQDGHIMKIKDPIVLQPVPSGYLIVSSWGLEASDPIVLNPINN